MVKAHDCLHDLCCAIRPPADTFHWLLDQQRAAPAFHCGQSTPLTDLVSIHSASNGRASTLHNAEPSPRQLKPLTPSLCVFVVGCD